MPSCARGFEYSLLSRQCQDIDECRSGRAGCDLRFERCLNLVGGYRCERLPLPFELKRSMLSKKRPACPFGFSYEPAARKCTGNSRVER